MPKPPHRPSSPRDASALEDSAAIDARYGLEPVFDPARADDGGAQGAGGTDAADAAAGRFETLQCPYCGERFETLVDLSAGSADYIEDCQVCCQPIEFSVQVDAQGRLARLAVRRGD
jgi:hypothetical protein